MTAGLHDAALVTRIEKSVPALAKAREDQNTLGSTIQVLNAELPIRSAQWQQALVNCQRILAEAGDPLPQEPWTPEGITKRLEAHTRTTRLSAGTIQNLRNAEGRLQRALGFLSVESTLPPPAKIQEQLKAISARQHELEQIAAPVITRGELMFDLNRQESLSNQDLVARLNGIDNALAMFVQRRKAEDEALTQTANEINRLRERQGVLAKELGEIEPVSEGAASIAERWASVLASVLEHLKGQDCPVCGRDYSELSQGDLRTHVIEEMNRIGADAKKMEERARRREQVAVENATVGRRLTALEAQFKAEQERRAKEKREQGDLDKLVSELLVLAPLRKEWSENVTSGAVPKM
jgi:DNA repair protein SbcC/Rad50